MSGRTRVRATRRKTLPTEPRLGSGRSRSSCRVIDGLRSAWQSEKRPTFVEWIDRNVRLPPTFGKPGKYDLDEYPFWREVIACFDDPDVYEIVLMCATQLGKTTAVVATMQAVADISPAPGMFVGPDRDYVTEKRDLVYESATLSPVLAARVPPAKHRNMRVIDLGNCHTYLAWAGNTQRISGKAAKYVWCSEVDRYRQAKREGKVGKLVAERVKSFTRYKIVWESTPTDANSAIADLYEQSDRRRLVFPCPHCGLYQDLRFFPHFDGDLRGRGGVVGIHDEAGKLLSPDEAMTAAYYACEAGCRIDNADKARMIAGSRWVPAGQSINSAGELVGTPERGPRVAGFQLSSLASPAVSFGRMAAEWLSCEDERDRQNFRNNWCGEKYTIRTKVPKWRELGRKLEAGYSRGMVPASALFLTAGVDVQGDRCYWVVRAWGESCTSWLVDWGVVVRQLGEHGEAVRDSDLRQLTELVIRRQFPLTATNPLGQTFLSPRLTGLDANYEPHRVWDFVRQWPADQVRAVVGSDGLLSEFYSMSVVERSARDGKPYEGGMQRWNIRVSTYKADIQDRWQLTPDQPGAWLLPYRILESGESYLQQVTNETQVTEPNNQGRQVTKWRVIEPRLGNHWWDTEVYARALADMVTGGDWMNLAERFRPRPVERYQRQSQHEEEFSAR